MLKTDASRQLLLAATLLLAAPIHAQVDAAQKAMMSVVGLDVTSGEIVTWCETRVPNASPPLRLAWQAWRRKSELDAIIAQLDAGLMQRTRDGMATVVAATQQKLAGAGLPATVCPQLVSMWNSAEFDTQRSYPEAYTARAAMVAAPISPPAARAAPTVAAAAPAGGGNSGAFAKPNGRFNTEYYASNPRPTGTVYTVAQITALKNQWTGTPWVAASRRLEPQQWSRWRLSGREYEFQDMDDYGKASGDWQRKPGQVLAGWPANKQLVGSYTATAFYGSIALGGTYTSNSFVFKPNGRWESINFSRSSSAAMAANEPVGFSSSAASVADGSGTKSSAGGGISGSSNGSVYAATSSSRDDGAKNRGTYKLDGMSIELTSDAGTVTRLLCVPLDDRFQRFYMLGQSYSNK